MSVPKRVQMSRQRPWRAEHPDAVIVDRRTKWGNPFRAGDVITPDHPAWGAVCSTHAEWRPDRRPFGFQDIRVIDTEMAVAMYRTYIEHTVTGGYTLATHAHNELAGRDLACWCPLEDADGNLVPCHADLLLELANPELRS